MANIGESAKTTNELIEICQKLLENSSYGDMTTLRRTLDNAFRQKGPEFQGMKKSEEDSILPMTVDLGKTVDNLIVQLKEASARDEKMNVDSPANARILMGKKEKVDEMYRKGKLAESLVGEENAGEEMQSSRQSKAKKKNSSGDGNEGRKISIVGMGGVGETRIENNSPVNFTFGNIQLS